MDSRIAYIWIAILLVALSCTEAEVIDAVEFYEIGSADDISLTVSSDLFVENGEPILLEAVVRDDLNQIVPNVGVLFSVDGDIIEGNSFIPPSSGKFILNAQVPALGLLSPNVEVVGIYEKDVVISKLEYSGPPYLTNNPWSVPQSFYVTAEINGIGRIKRKATQVFRDDNAPVNLEAAFDQAGEYRINGKIGNLNTDPVSITVREEPVLEEIQLPVVIHQLGADIGSLNVEEILNEVMPY